MINKLAIHWIAVLLEELEHKSPQDGPIVQIRYYLDMHSVYNSVESWERALERLCVNASYGAQR